MCVTTASQLHAFELKVLHQQEARYKEWLASTLRVDKFNVQV